MNTVDLARKSIESLYTGTCDIYEYQEILDPITKITSQKEVQIHTAKPCRISYQTLSSTQQTGQIYEMKQITRLFISPELEIKAGSKIKVTQNGVTVDYERSGEPAIYPTHQEIILQLFKGWA